MSTQISFDDGAQRVTINGDPERVIVWYPGDVNFVDRFLNLRDFALALPQRIAAIKGIDTINLSDNGETVTGSDDYVRGSLESLGAEFNAQLDIAFGAPVSAAAFGTVNPISPTPSGGYVFENLLHALAPLIEASFKDFEQSRKKYTDGWKIRAERRETAEKQDI